MDKLRFSFHNQISYYIPQQDETDIVLAQNIVSTGNIVNINTSNYPEINITVPALANINANVQLQLDAIKALCVISWPAPLIFTAGVLTINPLYYFPLVTDQTNWNDAYAGRIAALTTIGSSGSSTFIANTLNVPTYTLAGLGGQPLSTNLTSLSGLTYAATSFVKMTAAGTFGLDTNVYLTSLSGAVLVSQVTPQTIGDTTNRLLMLWATDITVTNAITGSVTGNAGSSTYSSASTITNDTTNAGTVYPAWYTANTGNLATYVSSTKLSFVPSTGILTSTGFSGPLAGNVTGNVSGSSGSCTGNAGSATYASAITIVNDGATAVSVYPTWVTANTGNLAEYTTSARLSFVPSTGILTATGFSGALTGNVTGNADTATNIYGGTANQIPYQTAANTTSFISAAASSVLVSSAANVPSWQSISSLLDARWTDIQRRGFVNNAQTSVSFNPATYIFTLTDLTGGTGWKYMYNGVEYTIVGNKTATLPGAPVIPAKNIYFIYIDSTIGTLIQSTIAWTLLDGKCPVAIVCWDDALTPKYWLMDERHTCLIDQRVHYYNHFTVGTRLLNGGVPTGFVIAPVVPVDLDNTFAISETNIADEDLNWTLAQLVQPNGTNTDYVSFYRTASSTWSWVADAMPYYYTPAGYINFDNAGTMTEGTFNKLYNSYLLYTNLVGASRYIVVNGRSEFSTLALARAEAVSLFSFDGLGIAEFVIAYQFTWETKSTYSTKGKCRLAANPVRLNIPNITASSVSPAVSHNSLSGLQGGTAGEYYHLSEAQYTIATQAATSALAGYLTSIDWTSFNTTINITNDVATAATMYPVWVTANTGKLAPYVSSTKFYFNPSTAFLTATGGVVSPKFGFQRGTAGSGGISWYSLTTYKAWCDYMASAALGSTTEGPTQNITPPFGTYVTSWALRRFIQNTANYGFTWESGSSTTATPAVIAELRSSDGLFHSYGAIIADGGFRSTSTDTITAYAGGGQANATVLTSYVNFVTVCASDNDSVLLLVAIANMRVIVKNESAKICDVYPRASSYMDGTINNPYSLAAGATKEFYAVDATHWKSLF